MGTWPLPASSTSSTKPRPLWPSRRWRGTAVPSSSTAPPSSSPPIVKTSREALARQLLSRIRSDVAALEALLARADLNASMAQRDFAETELARAEQLAADIISDGGRHILDAIKRELEHAPR